MKVAEIFLDPFDQPRKANFRHLMCQLESHRRLLHRMVHFFPSAGLPSQAGSARASAHCAGADSPASNAETDVYRSWLLTT